MLSFHWISPTSWFTSVRKSSYVWMPPPSWARQFGSPGSPFLEEVSLRGPQQLCVCAKPFGNTFSCSQAGLLQVGPFAPSYRRETQSA